MSFHRVLVLTLASALFLAALFIIRLTMPHQGRLLLGAFGDVEIVMTCRAPLIMGATVCLPEGHTNRGVYEPWVD